MIQILQEKCVKSTQADGRVLNNFEYLETLRDMSVHQLHVAEKDVQPKRALKYSIHVAFYFAVDVDLKTFETRRILNRETRREIDRRDIR